MGPLAVALVTLAAASSPTPVGSADSLARAAEHDPGLVTGATFLARPEGPTAAVGGAASATTQPLHGSTMAYLSNGDATAGWAGNQSENLSHDRSTSARGGHDVVVASFRLTVPDDANCLTLGASFFSEDYGDANTDDPRYFDTFLAELDPPAPWAAGAGDPTTLDAPANFAKVRMPDGPTPVSALAHSLSYSTQQAFGTQYDGTTQWHAFMVPVTPGEHTLDLSLFDRADGEYDSTVVVDDLRVIRRRAERCTYPGRDQYANGEDLEAPALTIAAEGSELTGTAGTAPSDDPLVRVRVAGETVSTEVGGGGRWSIATGGLEPGTYEARASQFDEAGNEGLSAPLSFTVEATSPEPEPEPTATSTPGAPGPPPPPPTGPGPAGPMPAGPPGGVPPAGAAPAPQQVAASHCKVPRLRGKTLTAAARTLRRAGCRIGRLSRKRTRGGKRKRVVAQSPRAGLRRAAGTRVKLTLRR